jgi:hypothetical protein
VNGEVYQRRSIRLPEYDYSLPGAYFITICTHGQKSLFGEIVDGVMNLNQFGDIVDQVMNTLQIRYPNLEVSPYVIMPNHVHLILNVNDVGAIHELPLPNPITMVERRKMTLPIVVGYFKMNTAKSINLFRHTPGQPVWQRNFYEHIIRNEQDMQMISEYIIANPAARSTDLEIH